MLLENPPENAGITVEASLRKWSKNASKNLKLNANALYFSSF
jgi:hypothetical protein